MIRLRAGRCTNHVLILLPYLPCSISELFSAFNVAIKVDELEKAISVAERDPAYYGLNEVEIGKRRNWTSTARNQVCYYRIFANVAANMND